jgi:hypothetical protein
MIVGGKTITDSLNSTIVSYWHSPLNERFSPASPLPQILSTDSLESMDYKLRTSEKKAKVRAGSLLQGHCPGERSCQPEEGNNRDGRKRQMPAKCRC